MRVDRSSGGFVQVTYLEHDRYPNPSYSTFQITGWIPASSIATQQTRHFFLLRCDEPTPGRWDVDIDNHRFRLFWAPLAQLPAIIPPQDQWVRILAPDHLHAV